VAGRPELARPEAWVEILGRLESDVLALQEAGLDSGRILEIARGLEMHAALLPSPLGWPGAILSRAPRRSGSRTRMLADAGRAQRGVAPREADMEPFSRAAGAVELELGADTGLSIVSLHAHPHDSSIRLQEARLLEEQLLATGAASRAAIGMGDFNTGRGEPLHAVLDGLGFANVFGSAGSPRTHLLDREHTRVDHIYLSAPLRPTLRSARVVREAGFAPSRPGGGAFSDHLPVVAELDWPGRSEARGPSGSP
jgi:endonuclease/exonuclease/phosphatase family metal-dependent hydrolase